MDEMKQYLGVKMVHARPMTRGDYNKYRGWPIPADENPADEGYLVSYDGEDYETWCPKDAFEKHNRPVSGLSFGHAIEAAKQGKKIARAGWNGKNMFVFLREGRMITGVDPSTPMGGDFESCPHFCMKAADGKCVVGWLASQTDMLSDDWCIVE